MSTNGDKVNKSQTDSWVSNLRSCSFFPGIKTDWRWKVYHEDKHWKGLIYSQSQRVKDHKTDKILQPGWKMFLKRSQPFLFIITYFTGWKPYRWRKGPWTLYVMKRVIKIVSLLCSIFYHLVFLIPGMKNLTHIVKLKYCNDKLFHQWKEMQL